MNGQTQDAPPIRATIRAFSPVVHLYRSSDPNRLLDVVFADDPQAKKRTQTDLIAIYNINELYLGTEGDHSGLLSFLTEQGITEEKLMKLLSCSMARNSNRSARGKTWASIIWESDNDAAMMRLEAAITSSQITPQIPSLDQEGFPLIFPTAEKDGGEDFYAAADGVDMARSCGHSFEP